MDIVKLLLERNEATWDRLLRVVVGVAIIAAFTFGIVGADLVGYIILLIGLIGIFTGISGHCLVYTLLGISTLGKAKAAAKKAKAKKRKR